MRVQRGTMVRAIMIVLGALLAIGLTGVANAGPDRMHGVVRGVVVIGPSCPGPAQRGATDCAARPIQTTVSVFAANARSADGAPVATVATDRDGRFQITLAPGVYRLVPAAAGGIVTAKPRNVTVTAGSTAEVRLFVDTGMR
jgi:hypothetical protein